MNRLLIITFYLLMSLFPSHSSPKEEVSLPTTSFSFTQMPIYQALKVIADKGGINLVVSEQIKGDVTLELNQVSWRQALHAVLHAKGLSYYQLENIMYIGKEGNASEQMITGRLIRVFPLLFSSADEMVEVLSKTFVHEANPSFTVQVDSHSNSIVARGSEEELDQVATLLSVLDKQKQQVEIEARIVTFYQREHESLGVNWNSVFTGENLSAELKLSPSQGSAGVFSTTTQQTDEVSTLLKLTQLGSDVLLDLELAALQSESKAKVISRPRLVTVDKTTAVIEQGTEIPYQESTSGGGTSIEFKKAVLSLEVTPYALGEQQLLINLSVTQDRPGEVVQAGTGQAVAINTQRVTTQVQVANGETLALGGIYQKSQTDSVYGVPLLGEIPVVGSLFRQTRNEWVNSELVIFITPRLIAP
ncbi:type IV pilus secretin PilQ [Vibrio sonorensis]|uniref:type IV pilus secretin PilQ n=1 Tax=Vibrio sonorensis TaxID=1004316 RepID=UPI0008DAC433|nr:type IV pilus secretin PilQ [Vibrio sonorensis]